MIALFDAVQVGGGIGAIVLFCRAKVPLLQHPAHHTCALVPYGCYRRPGPVSFWKRALEFPVDLEEWNAELPPTDDPEASRAWEEAGSELERQDVLIVRHSFRPWEPRDRRDPESESALGIWDRQRQELIPLTKVSPIVKGLERAWLADLQVHAFAATADHIDADEVIAKLSIATAV